MGTTLLRSGKIVDGTGKPAWTGHLLIEDDKIKALIKDGEKTPAADLEIDAQGLVIAPGFIDMHSHGDWLLPAEDHPETLSCMIEQGVTTLVGGNCGVSPAPIRPETLPLLEKFGSTLIDKPLNYRWRSMAQFLDHIQESEPLINLAEIAGHASIRYAATDSRRGLMSREELDACRDELRRAFDEGAHGLSFGLGYDPGMYSPLEELEALCKVAADAGKPATVHLKALSRVSPCYPVTYPGSHNVRALREMLEIAEKTGVMLQLSHFIFVGRNSWGTAQKCLKMVDDARARGLDVMIDAFPYTCGNTTILAPFPYWFLENLDKAYSSRLARARLKVELELGFRLVGFIYKDFQIMDIAVEGWEDLNGLRITDVAQKWKTTPFNAMLEIARKSEGATLMLFHTYSGEPGNEKPINAVLGHEACLFETDTIIKSRGYPNPAAIGTFPKILGDYVREKKMLGLEDAVSRMSGKSAERFGITDRGTLAEGKAADIVVFDPQEISDTPPVGTGPAGKPKGIRQVFINGEHAVENGEYLPGVRAGKVLRG